MAGKVKIRIVSDWSIVTTIVLAFLCVAISLFGYQKYCILLSATQDYIACEQAVHELQEGSDFLTKQVRLAASTGAQRYIDAYFKEANVTKTREKALADLTELGGGSDAIACLQDALSYSDRLMETEYYAMRLVEEAADTDPSTWPTELQAVVLSDSDAALSPSGKLYRAQQLVISPKYENTKDVISTNISNALDTLTNSVSDRQNHAAVIFTEVFRSIVFCVLLFALMMLLLCMMLRAWVVKPLLNYNENIKHGLISPVQGANELQTLANTYNKIYQENAEQEALIKHQAEHDPLTQLLNRGSFDRILNMYQKAESHFALILIDVDTFKQVNDTCGHAAGDAILKKVAKLLTAAFRNIDYVCRIGGDEFAIIMVDMTTDLSYTITDKMTEVNRQLAISENGEPPVSLSVGVAFTDRKDPTESLFKDADSALYYTKEHGRNGCHFYPAP